MAGYSITELTIGQTASFSKTVSESDIYLYAGVTGDINPLHINEEYAKTTAFKSRIAHGMLSAGFVSAVLGVSLPGPGSLYESQSLKFLAPVYIGDTITATAQVLSIDTEKGRVILKTTCTNQDETVVLDGKASIRLRKPK